jgi:hypothetical protein
MSDQAFDFLDDGKNRLICYLKFFAVVASA